MQYDQIISRLLISAGENAWIIQVFFIIFLVLLGNLALRIALQRLRTKFTARGGQWESALIAAIQGPGRLLIWVLGCTFAADIVYAETATPIFEAIDPIRQVGIISAVTWFLFRLTEQLQHNLIARNKTRNREMDAGTVDAMGKLLRTAILITAALVMLQTLGFSISGVLAFGGIGGIALGFAARDLLSNFFGGLMLYLDRPFAVGDWVRSPDREIEGTVEYIGWRLTHIRGFDMRPIYVPNGIFSTMAIVNPSRMTHRKIEETIGIRYQDADKMEAIVNAIKEMLAGNPEIAQDQTAIVTFNTFAPSSLNFFVLAYTRTTAWVHYHEVKQDVLLKISDIIRAHGAEFAFPTSTIHLPDSLRVEQGGPSST